MAIKVGINGFGRIGRQVYRAIRERYPERIDVVAVNDVGNPKIMTHLLKYDTNYGRFRGEVRATGEGFVADGDAVRILAERDPARLPWKQLGVEVVVERAPRGRGEEGRHHRPGEERRHHHRARRQRAAL
jgi:glyceraldehyde 3-phosphate dehydrogenase